VRGNGEKGKGIWNRSEERTAEDGRYWTRVAVKVFESKTTFDFYSAEAIKCQFNQFIGRDKENSISTKMERGRRLK